MSKYKVKLKLTGLEIEIEGDRETAPQLSAAINRTLAPLLSAPQAITNLDSALPANVTEVDGKHPPAKRRPQRQRAAKTESGDTAPIEFTHDAEKWGYPSQSWTTANKAIWLLFVVEQQSQTKEMSSSQIENTFNKHFRHAKAIQQGNVTRDLGKEARKKPSLVGEDNNKNPAVWYLTQAGRDQAQKLVAEVTGGSQQASPTP